MILLLQLLGFGCLAVWAFGFVCLGWWSLVVCCLYVVGSWWVGWVGSGLVWGLVVGVF